MSNLYVEQQYEVHTVCLWRVFKQINIEIELVSVACCGSGCLQLLKVLFYTCHTSRFFTFTAMANVCIGKTNFHICFILFAQCYIKVVIAAKVQYSPNQLCIH